MKVTYKTTRSNGTHIYSLTGTPEELAQYKTEKGSYYLEDTSEGVHKGRPLYFTTRALSSSSEYKLEKGNLEAETSIVQVQILDALSQVGKFSLNDLQKFAAMKAAGLLS
jgi:hypothetical protein